MKNNINIIWAGNSWEHRMVFDGLLGLSFNSLFANPGKHFNNIEPNTPMDINNMDFLHPRLFKTLRLHAFDSKISQHTPGSGEKLKKFLNQDKFVGQKNVLIIAMGKNPHDYSKKEFCELVIGATKKIKPQVSIVCGDGWGDAPWINNVAKHSKLVLKQYNHADSCATDGTPYPTFKNLVQIPVGYTSVYAKEACDYARIPLVPPSQRRYAWSFVGHIGLKKERAEMADSMYKLEPYYLRSDDPKSYITKKEVNNRWNGARMLPNVMKRTMNNSIFAPNCHGDHSHECCRLYESSMCGAIPVLCLSGHEFNGWYGRLPQRPPWLRYDNWEEATEECKKLLSHPDKIDELGYENFKWFKNLIDKQRQRIDELLSTN